MKESIKVQLVAIVGGSGAGKSWLVERLHKLLDGVSCRIALDAFYRDQSGIPPSRRERVNYDVPGAVDWPRFETVLRGVRAGHAVALPRYDFVTHRRLSNHEGWLPKPIVFVDGLWLLLRPSVRKLFDLTIYLDTAERARLRDRLARDVAVRGRDVKAVKRQFSTTVIPMHARHVEPQKKWADLVVARPFKKPMIRKLADTLWTLIERNAVLPPWMRETFRAELRNLME